jgi:hypothetical protein
MELGDDVLSRWDEEIDAEIIPITDDGEGFLDWSYIERPFAILGPTENDGDLRDRAITAIKRERATLLFIREAA